MKQLKFIVLGLVSVFYVGNVQAQTTVTVSTWQIHEGKEGVIQHSSTRNGDPSAYAKANIPAENDAGWYDAPVNSAGNVEIDRPSTLKCKNEVDFTYFQTTVNIPSNVVVNDFKVSYDQADDGARIYIFNSKSPKEGAFDPAADLIIANGRDNTGKVDLKSKIATGPNRIVIVQFDDCADRNTVKGIHVQVNGQEVETTDPTKVVHCGQEYNTVQINGRTWLETNIKLPPGGFDAMKKCCSELQQVTGEYNDKGRSPWSRANLDYDNTDDIEDPWLRKPFFSTFLDQPGDAHGVIFNYYATQQCDVCPSGFRLPTGEEFMAMANAVGGGKGLLARDKKENWGAIGRIDGYGSVVRGRFGEYWTSEVVSTGPDKANVFLLFSDGNIKVSPEDMRTGAYVRCIKEEATMEDCIFYWSTVPEVTSNPKVAKGKINDVGYTYTSSYPISFTNDIYNYNAFPQSEGIPAQKCIQNVEATDNTIEFDKAVKDPVLVFSSIGSGSTKVPIEFFSDINVLWKNDKVTVVNSRKIEGNEGYAIVQIKGTHKSINFKYTAKEFYVNFLFGVSVCSAENTIEELKASVFTINAFSVNQGKDIGLWYFGYNANDNRTARIVRKTDNTNTILTIEKVTVAGAGPDVYAFKVQGTNNYLAVEKGGGDKVVIESYSGAPPVEAQFRNHKAFTKAAGAEQFSSFESISKPKHFLRHTGYILYVHKETPDELFKQDASWKIEPTN